MTTTPTSGAADLPEALRSIQRFEVVDCIDDKHVPAVIPKPHGPWVRYEDHIAALAAGQATAAQQAPAGESLRTDALCDLSYSHGLKAGWNYCASDDLAGFERAQKIGTEALRTLKSTTAQADSQPAPPECETEAEKRAFAFGWFKALESERMKAESVLEDAARESEYQRGYRHGYEQRDAEVLGALA